MLGRSAARAPGKDRVNRTNRTNRRAFMEGGNVGEERGLAGTSWFWPDQDGPGTDWSKTRPLPEATEGRSLQPLWREILTGLLHWGGCGERWGLRVLSVVT